MTRSTRIDILSAAKGWAISLREPSPLGLRPEPLRVSAIRRVSTIAARNHRALSALACVAIWAGTFYAIGRL